MLIQLGIIDYCLLIVYFVFVLWPRPFKHETPQPLTRLAVLGDLST